MNFSSIPPYLDSSNWQQQHQNHHHQIISSSSSPNPLIPPPPRPAAHAAAAPPPPPPLPHGGGGGGSSIRPGSMSERARMANVAMPETSLKCPRCESTNTKFCYFNNYSLSQPRHFCKTCRRYWTRGGALRTVPVGGGCRRNKRTTTSTTSSNNNNNNNNKSNKSPASSDRPTTSTSTSSAMSANSAASLLGLNTSTTQLSPLRFMSPLSQLGAHEHHNNFTGDMMVGSTNEMSIGGMASLLSNSGGGGNNWLGPVQMQQFPFFGGLDQSGAGVYGQFQGGEFMRPKFSDSLLSQLASVKMEDNNPELSLSRQLLMGTDHHWNNVNANAASNWTDQLSSFSSSSTNN